jgi:hypothetical protein
MPIAVYCQECGKEYRVKDDLAGRRVRCPNGHVLLVPELETDLDLADGAIEVEAAPAATMPARHEDHNPYASPHVGPSLGEHVGERPTLKVGLPAVTLLVLGGLGLVLSIVSAAMALTGEAPQPDPNAPPIVQAFEEGSRGPVAAVIQIAFVFVNALIIVGAIQMLRFRAWGLALAASILALVNFGNCCCVPGFPVGIWSVVVLSLSDVREAFQNMGR